MNGAHESPRDSAAFICLTGGSTGCSVQRSTALVPVRGEIVGALHSNLPGVIVFPAASLPKPCLSLPAHGFHQPACLAEAL